MNSRVKVLLFAKFQGAGPPLPAEKPESNFLMRGAWMLVLVIEELTMFGRHSESGYVAAWLFRKAEAQVHP